MKNVGVQLEAQASHAGGHTAVSAEQEQNSVLSSAAWREAI